MEKCMFQYARHQRYCQLVEGVATLVISGGHDLMDIHEKKCKNFPKNYISKNMSKEMQHGGNDFKLDK
jgi:hypothetical protein